MSADRPRGRSAGWAEVARFLEVQNLGLNLPFALAFLLLAAEGLPTPRTFLLVVVAFVAARNAGHAFNRWVDRSFDALNPRTSQRALPQGRLSATFALGVTGASAAVVVAAAYFLNPLAFALSPVALALLLGYSYTKRFTALTTGFLGLVESITPAAAFVAVRGTLPLGALVAVGGVLAWGTAFETVHSLGDMDSDRALGLRSIPVRWGRRASLVLVGGLHTLALLLFAIFGAAESVRWPYFVGLGLMGVVLVWTDRGLVLQPADVRTPFRRHYLLATIFLLGVMASQFLVR